MVCPASSFFPSSRGAPSRHPPRFEWRAAARHSVHAPGLLLPELGVHGPSSCLGARLALPPSRRMIRCSRVRMSWRWRDTHAQGPTPDSGLVSALEGAAQAPRGTRLSLSWRMAGEGLQEAWTPGSGSLSDEAERWLRKGGHQGNVQPAPPTSAGVAHPGLGCFC